MEAVLPLLTLKIEQTFLQFQNVSLNYLPSWTPFDIEEQSPLTRTYVYIRQITKTVATVLAGFGVFENIYMIS